MQGFLAVLPHGVGELEVVTLGQRVEVHLGDTVVAGAAPAAGGDGAVEDGEVGVRDDQRGIDLHLHPQARTGRTGAVGVVEGEQPRRQLLHGDAAVLAGVVLGEAQRFAFPAQIHQQQPPGQGKRGFGGVGQAAGDAGLDHQAIHHDFNVVLFVLFELDFLAQIVQNPIHPCADIAGLFRVLEHLHMLALAPADHRGEKLDAAPLGQLLDAIHDLVNGLLANLPAALGAVGHADTRPEQTQVVVNLRHRADGGAGVAGGGFLVDGDGGGEAVDVVHIGLVHLPEEHARVGAQALHIAALTLGVDGVEGEGGLAAARKPGHDYELVAGNLYVDVFEVVFPRAFDKNAVLHRCFPLFVSFLL